jgi:hypothetical protein
VSIFSFLHADVAFSNFMKNICILLISAFLLSCTHEPTTPDLRKVNFPKQTIEVTELPPADNLWVFLLAGQSNMAGRGLVAPEDTISNPRILTIDQRGQLVYAKEPLHFYEANLQGLDCGLSFGEKLISELPDSISILILPTAVGGSSIEQWLEDSTHRGVALLSNFKEKVAIGSEHGTIKSILWHQGESNANADKLPTYRDKLATLFQIFRKETAMDSLPILVGELAAFPKNYDNRQAVNSIIHDYATTDPNTKVIYTQDLMHKGDSTHFDADGQRKMGVRFAEAYLELIK